MCLILTMSLGPGNLAGLHVFALDQGPLEELLIVKLAKNLGYGRGLYESPARIH